MPMKPGAMIMEPVPVLRGPVKRPRSTVQVEEAVGRRPSPLAAFSARDPTVCLPTHNQPQLEHTGTQRRGPNLIRTRFRVALDSWVESGHDGADWRSGACDRPIEGVVTSLRSRPLRTLAPHLGLRQVVPGRALHGHARGLRHLSGPDLGTACGPAGQDQSETPGMGGV